MISFNNTPLVQAKLKVFWAQQHIQTLMHITSSFGQKNPADIQIDTDPDTGHHRLRLVSSANFPFDIPLLLGDAVHNLRAALDYAVFKVVNPGSEAEASRIGFPFHEKRDDLVRHPTLKKIQSANSAVGDLILNKLRPYKDGNYPLWAITKLDNIDKHRLLLTSIAIIALTGVDFHDENNTNGPNH